MEKVHTMFAELTATAQVRHMIQAQYGERLSLTTLERYKSKQWRAQRELVQEMGAALNNRVMGDRIFGSLGIDSLTHRVIESLKSSAPANR
jgi:hypothetical protein